MKIKNLFKGEGFVNFSSSILAIVCGLLFGLIILLISNPSQAFGGFMMIIQGGFTDGMQGFGQVLYMATPLIMTGLSVGFAFKTGLFNIGASGQFTAGAFAAVYVGVKFTFLPPGVHCLAALLAAILASFSGSWITAVVFTGICTSTQIFPSLQLHALTIVPYMDS